MEQPSLVVSDTSVASMCESVAILAATPAITAPPLALPGFAISGILTCVSTASLAELTSAVAVPIPSTYSPQRDMDTRTNLSEHTALVHCAIAGDVDGVEALIAAGVDVNAVDATGLSAVAYAAASGHRDIVQVLLAANATAVVLSDGLAALVKRVCGDEAAVDVLEVLLGISRELREELTVRDEDVVVPAKEPLLLWATKNGYVDMVKLVLAACGDTLVKRLAVKDNEERTPLHVASEMGDVEIVRLLLAAGADTNARNYREDTPLHTASEYRRASVVKVLLRAGADVNARARDGQTPLHRSTESDATDIVQILLAAGADVHAKDDRGYTALHGAVEQGYVDMARVLLAAGAEVNATDHDGNATLFMAARRKRLEVVEVLLAAGAELHAKNNRGRTAFHVAVQLNAVSIVEALVAAGVDVNAKSCDGHTPLHVSIAFTVQNAMPLWLILLAARANVNAPDDAQMTPLHHAVCTGTSTLQAIPHLLAARADVNAKDGDGHTALHCAIRYLHHNRHPDLARQLVNAGMDVSAADDAGQTVLHLASAHQYVDVMKLLLDPAVFAANARSSTGTL